ncbi:unnamed protein product [Symbiodinium pilosum]|uniref:Uncharacterized protein n=1 Tax=Symbiodinium pilosum TaxID=2952 RepID=A0A812ND94_SYMPI|nr:unnamed protein product [Symbiodinium pilosum]
MSATPPTQRLNPVIDIEANLVTHKIDTEKEFSGDDAWKSLLAHGDRIYASPFNADRMLVVDVNSPKLEPSIEVSNVDSGQQKWNGMAEQGGFIFSAPVRAAAILVVDPSSGSTWGIPIRPSSEGATFNTITAVRHGVLLCPGSRKDLLFLDYADRIEDAIGGKKSQQESAGSCNASNFRFPF